MRKKISKFLDSKLLKYIIGGGIAALIDLAMLYLLVEIFHLNYIVGAIGAFAISFTFGFLFQKLITFKNFDAKHLKQVSLFFLFQIVGLIINISLLFIFVDIFHFFYLYVAISNKIIIFVWNFAMNNYFNFK